MRTDSTVTKSVGIEADLPRVLLDDREHSLLTDVAALGCAAVVCKRSEEGMFNITKADACCSTASAACRSGTRRGCSVLCDDAKPVEFRINSLMMASVTGLRQKQTLKTLASDYAQGSHRRNASLQLPTLLWQGNPGLSPGSR